MYDTHRIHVLDPNGVHGSVEDDPLSVVGALRPRLDALPNHLRYQPVGPLARHQVELAVQLAWRRVSRYSMNVSINEICYCRGMCF